MKWHYSSSEPDYRMAVERKVIIKASINNRIVEINLASTERDAYDDMKDKITYLGRGIYHSYNGVPAKDKEYHHFWKFRDKK